MKLSDWLIIILLILDICGIITINCWEVSCIGVMKIIEDYEDMVKFMIKEGKEN